MGVFKNIQIDRSAFIHNVPKYKVGHNQLFCYELLKDLQLQELKAKNKPSGRTKAIYPSRLKRVESLLVLLQKKIILKGFKVMGRGSHSRIVVDFNTSGRSLNDISLPDYKTWVNHKRLVNSQDCKFIVLDTKGAGIVTREEAIPINLEGFLVCFVKRELASPQKIKEKINLHKNFY